MLLLMLIHQLVSTPEYSFSVFIFGCELRYPDRCRKTIPVLNIHILFSLGKSFLHLLCLFFPVFIIISRKHRCEFITAYAVYGRMLEGLTEYHTAALDINIALGMPVGIVYRFEHIYIKHY